MNFRKFIGAVLPALTIIASCSKDADDNPVVHPVSTDATTAIKRVKMLAEFDAYSKNSQLYPLDAAKISGMFFNTANPFSDAGLNTSGISLREKTAENAKLQFDLLFVEMGEVALAYQSPAASGIKGSYAGTSSVRLFNERGLEVNQAIIKGLMGAVLLDQTLNHCLNPSVLNAAVSNEEREKIWDEGYNYIFGYRGPNDKKYFWESYLNTVNGNANFAGITQRVKDAFENGKTAIKNGNTAERDNQIKIIKENLSKVGAIRAVYYMNRAKPKLSDSSNITGDMASAFHALSEAYGFILGLPYTNNPVTNESYITKAKTDELLEILLGGGNGFWDVYYTKNQIDLISQTLASAFGFTVEQATAAGGSHKIINTFDTPDDML